MRYTTRASTAMPMPPPTIGIPAAGIDDVVASPAFTPSHGAPPRGLPSKRDARSGAPRGTPGTALAAGELAHDGVGGGRGIVRFEDRTPTTM